MMQFVDTNIFIRYLTRDDPIKAEACYQLLNAAKRGEVVLTTSESVIAEIVFVLASPRLYRLSREEVSDRLYPILTIEGFRIPERQKYLRALDLYVQYAIDYEDALTVATMEQRQIAELYSYDSDFDALPGVTRLEP